MEADEQEQNGSEEPLQLCFPLPPLKYFKRYTEAEVKNNLAPSPPKIISGSYSTFGDMFEVSYIWFYLCSTLASNSEVLATE